MSTRLQNMARAAEGRYFTPDERRILREYAESVPQRLEAAERVEQNEESILAAVIEEIRQRRPEFATHRDQPWARLYRDLQLVLRSSTQALVCDDERLLDERVLYWLRSVAAASDVSPAFLGECYTALRERCRATLPESAFRLLKPLLERAVEVLGQPEHQARSA